MKNKKIKKTTLAIILVCILGVLSIVYAALSTNLNINTGDASSGAEVSSWSIIFDDTSDKYGVESYSPDIAKPGTVAISSKDKPDDTATITGTKLHDYGAYVVYKLTVKNAGTKNAKITTVPIAQIEWYDSGNENSDVEVGIYTDTDCTTLLSAYTSETVTSPNYLLSGESTTWYVKVSYKEYGAGTSQTTNSLPTETKAFGFTIKPLWEEA